MPDAVAYATAFATYDGRNHILGASMLSDIDAHLRSSWPTHANTPTIVKRAKFLRKCERNGEMTVRRGGAVSAMPRDAACTVSGRYGDEAFAAWFMPDDQSPVPERLTTAHRIEEVESTAAFAGRCRIASDDVARFLLLIVDANKHVQLAGQPMQGRKWISELVSIENFAIDPALVPIETVLEIENLASRTAEARIFTLNRLRFVDGSGERRTLSMGFSFFPER